MMRILDTTLRTNPTTYEPELLVTLVVPLEPLRDNGAVISDDTYATLGKELVDALAEYTGQPK
jgi:hypothetical protein